MTDRYYELLGVSEDASTSEIEAAYRERIKETHPDVSDDEDASDLTKRLIDARDVLTDETVRERYDRLGHDAFLSTRDTGISEPTDGSDTTSTADTRGRSSRNSGTDQSSTSSTENSATDGSNSTTSKQSGASTGRASRTESTTRTGTNQSGTNHRAANQTGTNQTRSSHSQYQGTGQSWYDGESSGSDNGNGYQTWNADSSYAVTERQGLFNLEELFESQQTVVLLSMTFMIYPVLLFGALQPTFPLVVNLTVGLCIIFVIAFLQSIPVVGVIVFGTWSLFLPLILYGVVGISLPSIVGVLAMAAVLFPLGLSLLSHVAIKSMGQM